MPSPKYDGVRIDCAVENNHGNERYLATIYEYLPRRYVLELAKLFRMVESSPFSRSVPRARRLRRAETSCFTKWWVQWRDLSSSPATQVSSGLGAGRLRLGVARVRRIILVNLFALLQAVGLSAQLAGSRNDSESRFHVG